MPALPCSCNRQLPSALAPPQSLLLSRHGAGPPLAVHSARACPQPAGGHRAHQKHSVVRRVRCATLRRQEPVHCCTAERLSVTSCNYAKGDRLPQQHYTPRPETCSSHAIGSSRLLCCHGATPATAQKHKRACTNEAPHMHAGAAHNQGKHDDHQDDQALQPHHLQTGGAARQWGSGALGTGRRLPLASRASPSLPARPPADAAYAPPGACPPGCHGLS